MKHISYLSGLTAIAVAAFALSTPTFAQTAASPFAPAPSAAATSPSVVDKPHHEGMMKMMKELNLTPTEKANIKALVKSQRTQVEAVKANATLSDTARRQQMRQIRQSTLAQIRADLTPAQAQQMDADIAQQKAARKAARDGDQDQ